MKFNDIYNEEYNDDMDYDVSSEEETSDAYEMLHFDTVNLEDSAIVSLYQNAEELFSDTWGNVKAYIVDNREDLYGTYDVIYNDMTVFTVTLAG